MSQRRVVITGLGAVSPVGNNVKESWESIKVGKSGVDKITLFDASDYPVQIAAEVKNFDLESYGVDRKVMRKMNRQTKFLLGASIEAVKDAGYTKESIGKENAGIYDGVGVADLTWGSPHYSTASAAVTGALSLILQALHVMW